VPNDETSPHDSIDSVPPEPTESGEDNDPDNGAIDDGVPQDSGSDETLSDPGTPKPVESPDTTDTDSDGDGVPDSTEDGCPNSGDGNFDGTQDSQQANVASFHTKDKEFVTLVVPSSAILSECGTTSNPSPHDMPQGLEFACGFFDFKINNVEPGDTTTATLHMPQGTNPVTYYKYGPTPEDHTYHWYEFLYDGQTGADIDGNLITLYFVDGKRGDDDLAVNGAIVDQGGPGENQTSGGGCFISTILVSGC